ncbi:MAG: Mobile element protein [Firmicutes bacterium]|nr:Mobile element protein [Bacillota bacterium]
MKRTQNEKILQMKSETLVVGIDILNRKMRWSHEIVGFSNRLS